MTFSRDAHGRPPHAPHDRRSPVRSDSVEISRTAPQLKRVKVRLPVLSTPRTTSDPMRSSPASGSGGGLSGARSRIALANCLDTFARRCRRGSCAVEGGGVMVRSSGRPSCSIFEGAFPEPSGARLPHLWAAISHAAASLSMGAV